MQSHDPPAAISSLLGFKLTSFHPPFTLSNTILNAKINSTNTLHITHTQTQGFLMKHLTDDLYIQFLKFC